MNIPHKSKKNTDFKKGLKVEPKLWSASEEMLGSNSYEFNTTMECRDRDDDSIGGGGYNNINLMRNGRGKWSYILKWRIQAPYILFE